LNEFGALIDGPQIDFVKGRCESRPEKSYVTRSLGLDFGFRFSEGRLAIYTGRGIRAARAGQLVFASALVARRLRLLADVNA